MPLTLKPRSPLAPFTFSLSPPPSDTIDNNAAAAGTSALAAAPRPPADFIPEKDMYMFGTYPLLGAGEVGRGMIRCKRCGKVGLEWAAGEHRRICNHVLDGAPLTTKKVTKASKTTDSNKKRRASEVSESASVSPTKKRAKFPLEPSVDEEDDDALSALYKGSGGKVKKSEMKKAEKDKMRAERKEAKEKERMEIAERKRLRASNPINLDRQCGVINDKNIPCARSLTCKTHTVGAKRSVEGRSRPYDELYIEWQRANNPNYKEPQKREKIEKEKKVSSLPSFHGKGLGAGGLKKKKMFGRGGMGDEGLRDDEDGQREMEELIAITRLAGERVRNTFGRTGFGPITSAKVVPPTPGTVPGQPAGQNSATAINGSKSTAGKTSTSPTLTSTSGASANGSASSSTRSTNSLTIPFLSVWRSSSNEYTDVGSMLTKALAARVKPTTTPHASATASATAQQKAAAAAAVNAVRSGGTAGGASGSGRGPQGSQGPQLAQGVPQGLAMPVPNIHPQHPQHPQHPHHAHPHQHQQHQHQQQLQLQQHQHHQNAQMSAQAQAFAQAQAQALAHQAQMARQQLAAAAAAGSVGPGAGAGGGGTVQQAQGVTA